MQIAILAYEKMTALDAVGPYEVLSRIPGARVDWVAAQPGPKRTDAGLVLVAEHGFERAANPDVLLIPGAASVKAAVESPETLAWIRQSHETSQWTTSVCTGSLVLAAAGVLQGHQATTHWAAKDALAAAGVDVVDRRVVRDGKIVTAAGVSAGIDMALQLVEWIAGRGVAERIQLGIEYDPEPPFDCGSVTKASPEAVESLRRALAKATGL